MSSSLSSSLWIFVVFVLLSGSAYASEDSKNYVVHLDASNFTEFVSKQRFIAVEFYAPWCGHCKDFAPEWEKAAKILSENEPPIVLAKVDAADEQNMKLAAQFDIRGLPTVKILKFGGIIVHDYTGSREGQGIAESFKKLSGPPSAEIKSPEDASAIIADKKITIVGVFPEFSGEKYHNFTTLAEKLRTDIEFAHTTDAKLLPRGDSSVSGPIIRLFKPFDELFVDFQEFNVDALVKQIEVSSIPLVTILQKEDPDEHFYVKKYFSNRNAKAMLFLKFNSDNFDVFKSKFRDVAEQFKGQGVCFLIGNVDEASEGAFKFYGLKEEQLPLVVIQGDDGTKYLKPNVAPEEVLSYIKDFVDGKLQPYKKSEPIPEVNDEPLKVVVGANLNDMVFKSSKNVLLEFYAPECGHCKKFAPILAEVAASFQNDPDVVVAKMDAQSNDFPPDIFDVQFLPALFFKSASGKISMYEGDMTKEEIIKHIEKNKDKADEKAGKAEL